MRESFTPQHHHRRAYRLRESIPMLVRVHYQAQMEALENDSEAFESITGIVALSYDVIELENHRAM